MKIEGKTYILDFDGKTLTMSGKISVMPEEYRKMDEFFEKVIQSVSESRKDENGTAELIVDLRELIFLNSSGIKTLCVSLVMEADEVEGFGMKILCSRSLDWQVDAMPAFEDLMDNLEIVFE